METIVNHETAITTHAAERYILGDMDDREAEAFEEHFFDCRACAQDVGDTASFAENARVAFLDSAGGTAVAAAAPPSEPGPATPQARHAPVRARPHPWYHPGALLPWAAALILGSVALFQATVTVPRLARFSEPTAMQPTVLRIVRASPPVVSLSEGQPTFPLVVDVDVTETAPRYRLEFLASDGDMVATVDSVAPETGTLFVVLPATRFPTGDYTMLLRAAGAEGETGRILEEYRFRVDTDGS